MKAKLQQLMKSEGLTSSRLAEMLDVQPSGISHILSGRNKPGFDLLQKILRRFPRIDPDWLLLDGTKMFREERSEIDGAPDIGILGEGSAGSRTGGAHERWIEDGTIGKSRGGNDLVGGGSSGRSIENPTQTNSATDPTGSGHATGTTGSAGTGHKNAGEFFGGMFDFGRDGEFSGSGLGSASRGIAGDRERQADREAINRSAANQSVDREFQRKQMEMADTGFFGTETTGAEGLQASDIRGQYVGDEQPRDPREVYRGSKSAQIAQRQRVERVILVYVDQSFEELTPCVK